VDARRAGELPAALDEDQRALLTDLLARAVLGSG
jgi:hypothetical protein